MANTWLWRDTHSGPVAYLTPTSSFSGPQGTVFETGNPFNTQLFHARISSSRPPSHTATAMTAAPLSTSSPIASAPSAGRKAGRKRSRDEMTAEDLHLDSSAEESSSSSNATSPDAMTDLPNSLPPNSYTEDVSERLRSSTLIERPALESRKSIRLLNDTSSPSPLPQHDTPQDPSADDAALTLGIGWSTVPSTPTMIAASRGWAKHVEHNFPLQSVRFVWHNRAMPTYLVSAVTRNTNGVYSPGSPGYYLFNEELTYGQLVAKSWERALDNLRERPMLFDGAPMVMPGSKDTQAENNRPLIDSMGPSPPFLCLSHMTATHTTANGSSTDAVGNGLDIEMSG